MVGDKKKIVFTSLVLIALSLQLPLALPGTARPFARAKIGTIFGEVKAALTPAALICDASAAGGAMANDQLANPDKHNYESKVDSDLNLKLPVEEEAPLAKDPLPAAAQENKSDLAGSISRSGGSENSNSNSNSNSSSNSESTSNSESNGSVAIANTGGKQHLSLPANDFIGEHLLKGNVTATPANSPILQGSLQTLPKGTKVALIAQCYLNSQTSQKGEEVAFRIAQDVKDGDSGRVFLPGNWVAHGFVTEAVRPGRNGTPGRVNVTIDKIVSPDGQYDLPFECKISTADSKMLATSKLIARDIKFTTIGAAAGAILSVQMTGLGVAISTHGISVGVGAVVGATIGATSALVRHGDIASISPNDEMRLETAEPIALPGFNPANLPSAEKKKMLDGLRLSVKNFYFGKDSFTFDKKARILFVDLSIVNNSRHLIDKSRLFVVSNKGVRYPVDFRSAAHSFQVPPKTEKAGRLAFSVDSPKNKYYLIVVDAKGDEFSRAPIN